MDETEAETDDLVPVTRSIRVGEEPLSYEGGCPPEGNR